MKNILLSVVIPTLNEEKYLPRCLKSIENQSYKGKVNIIISDNGSTDKTVKIAKKNNCYLVTGSRKGNIALARKLGCQKAKELAQKHKKFEEIIINTDADGILDPNYFRSVVKAFKNNQIMAASGPFLINHPQIPIKQYGRLLIFLHGLALFLELRFCWFLKKIFTNTFLYGGNAVLRRSFYEKIGGWDEQFELLEDLAMTLKVLKSGYQINYIKGLKIEISLRKFVDRDNKLRLISWYEYGFKDKKIREMVKLTRQVYKK